MNIKRLQIIIVVLAIAFAGMYYSKKMIKESAPSEEAMGAIETVLTQQWELRKIADTGLAMLVPDKMKHIPTKLEESAKETLDSYSAFEYKTEPFMLKVNYMVAKYDLSSEEYAKELTAMLKSSGDITGFESETIAFEEDGMKGSFVKGEGTQGNQDVALNSVIIADNTKIWEVTIGYYKNDKRLVKLAQDIIKSIQIQ